MKTERHKESTISQANVQRIASEQEAALQRANQEFVSAEAFECRSAPTAVQRHSVVETQVATDTFNDYMDLCYDSDNGEDDVEQYIGRQVADSNVSLEQQVDEWGLWDEIGAAKSLGFLTGTPARAHSDEYDETVTNVMNQLGAQVL